MNNVAVGIVLHDRKILMVRRRRPEGCLRWQFPGGLIERDEATSAAVEREVLEEAKVNCSALRLLGRRVHPDTGIGITYFLCKYLGGHVEVKRDEGIDRVEWMTPNQVFLSVTSNIYPPVKRLLEQQV